MADNRINIHIADATGIIFLVAIMMILAFAAGSCSAAHTLPGQKDPEYILRVPERSESLK